MKQIIIVLNGSNFNKKAFDQATKNKNSFIIAVDGGLNHIQNYKTPIDLHIGDMDSVKKETLELYSIKHTKKYPAEKYFSDYHLALQHAHDQNIKNVLVFAYAGNRTDHFLSNYESSLFFAKQGLNITLVGEEETIYLKNKSFSLDVEKNKTVSIYSGLEETTDVTLKGLEYPLQGATLYRDVPLGLSNVSLDKHIEITFKDGLIVCIVN